MLNTGSLMPLTGGARLFEATTPFSQFKRVLAKGAVQSI
jgi:hypothetical protein